MHTQPATTLTPSERMRPRARDTGKLERKDRRAGPAADPDAIAASGMRCVLLCACGALPHVHPPCPRRVLKCLHHVRDNPIVSETQACKQTPQESSVRGVVRHA